MYRCIDKRSIRDVCALTCMCAAPLISVADYSLEVLIYMSVCIYLVLLL
jgi:hypothetical protein